jgi:catechol 2,3-dioxygenase
VSQDIRQDEFHQMDVERNCPDHRIGHVNLRVSDLDRASRFYCDVLGLSMSYYGPDYGFPLVFLAFGDYHRHVVLNWFLRQDPLCPQDSRRGLNHFAIVYPNEDALARAVTRVLEYGDLLEDARDHGGTLSVYLRDPDGNSIELYFDRPRSHWFDSDGQLVMKSESFNVRRWLEGLRAPSLRGCQLRVDCPDSFDHHGRVS